MINTPWGIAQQQYSIAEGVWQVDTAGHGGIMVHTSVARTLLSPAALEQGWHWGQWYAYEKDCDWALFAYEQSELYAQARSQQGCAPRTAEQVKADARASLVRFHSKYLALLGQLSLEDLCTILETMDSKRKGGPSYQTLRAGFLTNETPMLREELRIVEQRLPDGQFQAGVVRFLIAALAGLVTPNDYGCGTYACFYGHIYSPTINKDVAFDFAKEVKQQLIQDFEWSGFYTPIEESLIICEGSDVPGQKFVALDLAEDASFLLFCLFLARYAIEQRALTDTNSPAPMVQ